MAQRQGLVHRDVGVAEPADALEAVQRLRDRLAQHDAGVLHRVVHVDVQVALGLEVRSMPPWRAKLSSMWSKKPMPV